MLRWNNDYNRIAHPRLLQALTDSAANAYPGYGADEWCDKAAALIRELTACPEASVHFLPGATQANFIVIAAALPTIEGVICAYSGHIYGHEAGSIENTRHKLLPIMGKDGKITAQQIDAEAAKYYDGGEAEYLNRPGLVYISMATEWGTVYSLAELEAIAAVCKKYDMYLFVDGARLSYGLAATDVTVKDMARLCDAFYFGGTKCGAMFGEALVLVNKKLQRCFKTYMKQNGAVLAKGWLMGLQFYELLKDGLYFELAKAADAYAMQIRDALIEKGIEMLVDSPTNQIFPVMNAAQLEKIGRDHIYEDICVVGENRCVRFCTSWATEAEAVDQLIKDIRAL